MQASLGVHAAPKWKHAPAPLARQVKYALAPAWYAHVGAGQPIDGNVTEAAWACAPVAGAGLPVGFPPGATTAAFDGTGLGC